MKQLLMATLLAIAIVSSLSALANGSAASLDASKTLSVGVGSIVVGSASLVAARGQAVVESVENTADGVLMVLHGVGAGVSEAGKFSLKITGDVSGAASVAVGQSMEVVAETAGSAIIASGKVIAFIPNALGKSLMHHSEL